MEIEGFRQVTHIIALAKELYDIGRFDIVEKQFVDPLCYDVWCENVWAVITSVFSVFNSSYDEKNEDDIMVFEDDVIGDYYRMACDYGRRHGVSHAENPFVTEAEQMVSASLNFCCSLEWELLGYTKTKKAARKSKLIVYAGVCECDCHTNLAYNLVWIYKWFSDKCAEFKEQETDVKEVIAS